ncbi:OmpA family protein [Luteolibacter ambystomatis]|uniref:OmpA family protein n=1 Tax=Luteolibacter ambystomatis TaxID=2824561 RepID=A0A975J2L7_9BACT|nr:OmpA family protein [Luteolibacter ambystomatis]QUE52895.1 OmpA family protein [Luteolibacter ambystomatis]
MTEPAAPTPSPASPAPSATVAPSAPAPAPVAPPVVVPAAAPVVEAPKPAASPAVLVLGFIIMALLGAILAVNLKPKATTPETSSDIAARIKKDSEALISMNSRSQGQITERDSQLLSKTKEIIDLERTNQVLMSQYATAKADLERALANSGSIDITKRQLSDALKQVDGLTSDLAKVRAELASYANRPDPGDVSDLQRRLDEALRAKGFYETKAKELEIKLASLTAQPAAPSRLFAASENELLPNAVALFRGLRELEGRSDSEILAAYTGFSQTFGAAVVSNVNFPTGSSTPSPADDDALRAKVRTEPDDGLLLVVGYASKTGNVDDNRTLSSNRATAVANSLDAAKLPGQKVQAVYLGQTDRFGSSRPERNQICEVWHIRTKN